MELHMASGVTRKDASKHLDGIEMQRLRFGSRLHLWPYSVFGDGRIPRW
jgi:hypothetical protein